MPISPSNIQGYSFGSAAERTVYDFAVNEKTFNNSDRYLFHSLSICHTGNAKIKGEIDFVYLDRECILFLEVKGGSVKYDAAMNDWYVMGGTVKGDPFKQAYDGLFQTRDTLLVNLFGNRQVTGRLTFGIGVMFPECIMPQEFVRRSVSGMEYDPTLIFDFSDTSKMMCLSNYIERLKKYWTSHIQFRGREGISARELSTVADFFRKSFHFSLPITNLIEKGGKEQYSFTKIQMYSLDTLDFNPGKAGLIQGGPGTGKTILALELLRRKCLEGKKVLFLCFNKNLLNYLKARLPLLGIDIDNVEMRHLHGLLRDEDYVDSTAPPVEDNNEQYWSVILPLFFFRHLKQEYKSRFDYVIVDEGQDILNEYQFDAIGSLLNGGLDSGAFAVFLDKDFQNIYNKDAEEYFSFLRHAYPTIMLPLQVNCRNTTSMVRTAAVQTGLPMMKCLRQLESWKSQIKFSSSEKDRNNQLIDILAKLEKDGVGREQINILCADGSQVDNVLAIDRKKFHTGALPLKNRIGVLTIHSFKGLENQFIVTLAPDNYEPNNLQQMHLLYIANTRACAQSIVLIDRKFKYIIDERYDQIDLK